MQKHGSESTMKIGEILIQQNSITREQLNLALWVQKNWGGLIGRILCARGYLSEAELTAALSIQLGIPAVSLRDRILPDISYCLLPLEFCLSRLVLPFSQDPDTGAIFVAMADPRDAATRAMLRSHIKFPCTPYVCGYNDITQALYILTHPSIRLEKEETPAETVSADAIMEETSIAMPPPSPAATVMDGGDILEENEIAEALFGHPDANAASIPVDSGDFEILDANDIDSELSATPTANETASPGDVQSAKIQDENGKVPETPQEKSSVSASENAAVSGGITEPSETESGARRIGPPPSPFSRSR